MVIRRIFQIVKRINLERKTSILLAEQNFRAALSVADFIYLLENGKMALHGTVEELKDNAAITQFYLGHLRFHEEKND
jgi:branched-chain amino acid transport system ATP-binding protein